jgi:hypothetical protein
MEVEPGLKSATASSVTKPAKTETGLVVQVPPFINEGEKIKVDTAEGTYLSRAQKSEVRSQVRGQIAEVKTLAPWVFTSCNLTSDLFNHTMASTNDQSRPGSPLSRARTRPGRRLPLVCRARGAHPANCRMGAQQSRWHGRSAGHGNARAVGRIAIAPAGRAARGARRQRRGIRRRAGRGTHFISSSRSLI